MYSLAHFSVAATSPYLTLVANNSANEVAPGQIARKEPRYHSILFSKSKLDKKYGNLKLSQLTIDGNDQRD
jgi:hypothetical protein